MPYPTIRAGMRLTAAMLQGLQTWHVEQGSDQTTSNNNSTWIPTNLVVPMSEGGVYVVHLSVSYLSSLGAGLQTSWQDNASGNGDRFVWGAGVNGGPNSNNVDYMQVRRVNVATATSAGFVPANPMAYQERCIFRAGSDGNFTFRFRQWTATGDTTRIQAESFLTYVRVG